VTASFTSGDAARYLLAFFLLATGLSLGYALLKLASVLGRLASFVKGAEREVMPVINKVGGSVDRVNSQLDKMDAVTDSAVDAVQAVDQTVRTLSFAVRRPVEKLVGLSSGVSHGWATLRKRRDWRQAVESAKEASARREADFEEELTKAQR
jgi:uncharacterized protein YoxC